LQDRADLSGGHQHDQGQPEPAEHVAPAFRPDVFWIGWYEEPDRAAAPVDAKWQAEDKWQDDALKVRQQSDDIERACVSHLARLLSRQSRKVRFA
jgi:hypothetical protein